MRSRVLPQGQSLLPSLPKLPQGLRKVGSSLSGFCKGGGKTFQPFTLFAPDGCNRIASVRVSGLETDFGIFQPSKRPARTGEKSQKKKKMGGEE